MGSQSVRSLIAGFLLNGDAMVASTCNCPSLHHQGFLHFSKGWVMAANVQRLSSSGHISLAKTSEIKNDFCSFASLFIQSSLSLLGSHCPEMTLDGTTFLITMSSSPQGKARAPSPLWRKRTSCPLPGWLWMGPEPGS